jgi:hypothetical protein
MRKINTIFAMFRVFSIIRILIFFQIFQRLLKNRESFGVVGVGGEAAWVATGVWAVGG